MATQKTSKGKKRDYTFMQYPYVEEEILGRGSKGGGKEELEEEE